MRVQVLSLSEGVLLVREIYRRESEVGHFTQPVYQEASWPQLKIVTIGNIKCWCFSGWNSIVLGRCLCVSHCQLIQQCSPGGQNVKQQNNVPKPRLGVPRLSIGQAVFLPDLFWAIFLVFSLANSCSLFNKVFFWPSGIHWSGWVTGRNGTGWVLRHTAGKPYFLRRKVFNENYTRGF